MNIENMEQEFPKMPQSMRDMIEKEVEKQVKVTPQRGYFSLKKAVVASLAATFVLGTTIFAGTKLYRMSSSPQGNYGMTTKIEKTDATENTEKIDPAPQLAMKLSYLPDGMTETEEGKYSYEQTPGAGGSTWDFALGRGSGKMGFRVSLQQRTRRMATTVILLVLCCLYFA